MSREPIDLESLPISERDELVAATLRFMADRGYVITMPERPPATAESIAHLRDRLTGRPATAYTPPEDIVECCASGRCEVCSPGFTWGN